jgi:DNA-binding transcriptional LysR family regulator
MAFPLEGKSTELASSAGHGIVTRWLSGQAPGPREPMPLGTVKSAVASSLGMALVPEVATLAHGSDFIVRPLRPPLTRTLALIERRNKPNEPAIEIVRNALLELTESAEPPARSKAQSVSPRKARSGRAW